MRRIAALLSAILCVAAPETAEGTDWVAATPLGAFEREMARTEEVRRLLKEEEALLAEAQARIVEATRKRVEHERLLAEEQAAFNRERAAPEAAVPHAP